MFLVSAGVYQRESHFTIEDWWVASMAVSVSEKSSMVMQGMLTGAGVSLNLRFLRRFRCCWGSGVNSSFWVVFKDKAGECEEWLRRKGPSFSFSRLNRNRGRAREQYFSFHSRGSLAKMYLLLSDVLQEVEAKISRVFSWRRRREKQRNKPTYPSWDVRDATASCWTVK